MTRTETKNIIEIVIIDIIISFVLLFTLGLNPFVQSTLIITLINAVVFALVLDKLNIVQK